MVYLPVDSHPSKY